jgi:general secretion pathway protein K
MKAERGFALLAVILVLSLLAVVVTEFGLSMRLEASMVRSYRAGVLATYLAEAGVHQAITEVLSQAEISAVDGNGLLAFYRAGSAPAVPQKVPPLPRSRVPLGPGEFSYRITDEEGRLDLNSGSPDRINRLLSALGVERGERDIIGDSLQDWKDADDAHRTNGAESDDYYLKLPVPYRARNGPLQDATELLQVRGVSRELYQGNGERPGLRDLVTVFARDTVNMNTAPPQVLKALGLSDAEVTVVTQTRERLPYRVVPGPFVGRRLGISSATFRVESEGVIAGEGRVRIVAIIRRGGTGVVTAEPLGVSILSWRSADADPS